MLPGLLPIYAQEEIREVTPFDVSVSPPTAYLKINPGNNSVHTIAVKNNGTEELIVTPKLVSFSADGETGQPRLSDTSDFPYLDQDRTSFETLTLPPGATAQLTLHFSVPASAENREYPLTVLFESTASNIPSSSTVTPIAGITGSNIVVLISNSETLENVLTVEDFGSYHVIDSFSRLEFSPLIKNNSFAASVASGSATLYNWRGKEITTYQVSPTVVLGYSSRKIEPFSGENVLQDEKGVRLFTHDSAFLIGPYSFSVFLPTGDPAHPIYKEQKIIVWAVPFVLLGTIAVTCFILGGYYYYKKRTALI